MPGARQISQNSKHTDLMIHVILSSQIEHIISSNCELTAWLVRLRLRLSLVDQILPSIYVV
jgi:hypothetical protein